MGNVVAMDISEAVSLIRKSYPTIRLKNVRDLQDKFVFEFEPSPEDIFMGIPMDTFISIGKNDGKVEYFLPQSDSFFDAKVEVLNEKVV